MHPFGKLALGESGGWESRGWNPEVGGADGEWTGESGVEDGLMGIDVPLWELGMSIVVPLDRLV
jgi:hypothetical protein